MTKIYGYSDDIVEIEIDGGDGYIPSDEIDCYDRDVRLIFNDGTIALVHYGKGDKAIWQISVLEEGDAEQDIEVCADEDGTPYSDILYINAELDSYDLVDKQEPNYDIEE